MSGAVKDATDPPPLPIRIPFVSSSSGSQSPSSPTPRVIHYASGQQKPEAVSHDPTKPTWTVAVSRPMTAVRPTTAAAARPAGGQHVILRPHTSPAKLAMGQPATTKLVQAGQQPRPGTVHIQLPPPSSSSLIRPHQSPQLSPDNQLLILMSPKDGTVPRISPTQLQDRGGLVVSPTKIVIPSQQGKGQGEGLLIAKSSGGLVLTTTPSKSPSKQTLQKPVDETQVSPASSTKSSS